MSNSANKTDPADELPKAKVARRKWTFPIVWVVPVIAAFVAGYLIYERAHEFGARITVTFRDVSGLKSGETPIKFRGFAVGEVKRIELSKDQQYVEVTARLRRSAASIARDGSLFW